MCIALLSTAHPAYTLILLDNRDEFLNRPTAPAEWWPAPHEHVLGGRDLLREAHGTWLGITKDGRVAVLTNFREESNVAVGAESRGAMINAFLTTPPNTETSTETFVQQLITSGKAQRVGGFSLVCGRAGMPLAVVSNRVADTEGISWIAGERGQTVGLSNAAFGDRGWKKVTSGEQLLDELIKDSIAGAETEEQFLQKLLQLLSIDTLPREAAIDGGLDTHINQLRNTIFVPALGRRAVKEKAAEEMRASKTDEKAHLMDPSRSAESFGMSGLYGTQKQTIVLVRTDGSVRYFERSLYDADCLPIETGKADVDFDFKLSTEFK